MKRDNSCIGFLKIRNQILKQLGAKLCSTTSPSTWTASWTYGWPTLWCRVWVMFAKLGGKTYPTPKAVTRKQWISKFHCSSEHRSSLGEANLVAGRTADHYKQEMHKIKMDSWDGSHLGILGDLEINVDYIKVIKNIEYKIFRISDLINSLLWHLKSSQNLHRQNSDFRKPSILSDSAHAHEDVLLVVGFFGIIKA